MMMMTMVMIKSGCWLEIDFGVFFFKIFLFGCGPFLKSLFNLLQYCFCFMFWVFGFEACGILVPWPGIGPTPPALKGSLNLWATREVHVFTFDSTMFLTFKDS